MSNGQVFLEKGIFHGTEARKLDERAATSPKGQAQAYAQALGHYNEAIKYFEQAIRFGKNPKQNEQLSEHRQQWIKRAAQLQEMLQKGKLPQGAAGAKPKPKKGKGGSGSGTGGSGGGGGGGSSGGGDGEEEMDEEEKKMRNALEGAVVTEMPNVKWDDVAGLEGAKDALKEAVILPKKFPQMFTGNRKPWKGVLLYGPPGTGKSYLAKAVATEAGSYFISVSSSDLVSKWQGDSEKLVKALFALAREKAPSVVFIDEIDSLVSSRSDGESESSRRIKTEFLVQMDGVGNGTDGILVLGATNLPWALDSALLRRMERRVLISLPDEKGRLQMFKMHLGTTPHALTEEDFRDLAGRSDGYSGSDLKTVCRDAVMEPVRLATKATHFKLLDGETDKWTPCVPGAEGATVKGIMDLDTEQLVLPKVTKSHFDIALSKSKPASTPESLAKYEEFTRQSGQDGR